MVSAPPGRARSQFFEEIFLGAREVWRVGMFNLSVLACVLRTTTKKGHQLFEGEKCTPEKIVATPMKRTFLLLSK